MYDFVQILVICILMFAFGFMSCWILHRPLRDLVTKVQSELDWITRARIWYEQRIAESGEEIEDAN